MLKDLMLALTGTPGDENAIRAAIAIAARHDARLSAVVPVEALPPLPAEWGAFPATLYTELYEDARRRAEQVAAALRPRLAKSGVKHEVRLADAQLLQASRVSALHARHADLVVMGRMPAAEGRVLVENLFADLLLGGGRPLLVVPPAPEVTIPAQRVVIAWQPTRESSRALHDALPLMHQAQSIDVLMIDPQVGEGLHGEQPGADIAAHLARHGLPVQVMPQPRMGQTVGEAILRHVRETDAHLLVAGGYSHSRLREQFLGGVTRELFANATVPVLFSH